MEKVLILKSLSVGKTLIDLINAYINKTDIPKSNDWGAVFEFAKKNNVPMNTAQLYLDMQMKPATTQLMMLGKEPKNVPTLGRTVEVAQKLYDQNTLTFSKGGAKKRYAIRVENNILKKQKYSYDELMEALQTIPANEIALAELLGCADKEYCIMETLTAWMIDMQRAKEPAA